MCVHIDGYQRTTMKMVLSFHLNVASETRTQVPRFVLETPLPSESSWRQNAMHLISTAIPPCLSYVNSHSPFPTHISVMWRCKKHLKWVNAQPPATWATPWDQRINLGIAFLQSRQAACQLWSSSLGMCTSFQTAKNCNQEPPRARENSRCQENTLSRLGRDLMLQLAWLSHSG